MTTTEPIDGITPLNVFFSAFRLRKTLSEVFKQNGVDETLPQIMLTHGVTPDWTLGSGSLFDYENRKTWGSASEFTTLHATFIGTYVEEVMNAVKAEAEKIGRKIGRSRKLSLLPKTCYSLHTDNDEFRFHIPLQTNPACFFVTNNVVGRMLVPGQLYLYSTSKPHTAVNASLNARREHLVFDTYVG